MKAILEVDTERMQVKKVAKAGKGQGMIYLPKELIGQTVTVIWDEKK